MGTFTATVVTHFTAGYSQLDFTYTLTDPDIKLPDTIALSAANIGGARSQVSFSSTGQSATAVTFTIFCKYAGEPNLTLIFSNSELYTRYEDLTGAVTNNVPQSLPGTFEPPPDSGDVLVLDSMNPSQGVMFSVNHTSN